MNSKEVRLAVTDGLILGPEGVGGAALLAPPGALPGPPLGRHLPGGLDHVKLTLEDLIPRPGIRRREPAAPPVPGPEPVHTRPLSLILEGTRPQGEHGGMLELGAWVSPLPVSSPRGHVSEWPRLHRFVDLSALGWAFVLAAACWEAFAFAFNHYAGWGWDRGAFFFAWGLGILACGFYLRTTRKQPADSHLFLGLNALFLSVLTIVVVTR